MSIKETSEGTLEAESRSKTLLGTIKNSWSNIAQKLSDIDHTTGPWTPGTHPFNHFKYKIIRRKITFAAATRNCGRLSGSLLHGDIDIAKYIPELEKETKIWYSTKDTRPIMAMKNEDIQKMKLVQLIEYNMKIDFTKKNNFENIVKNLVEDPFP